jgi:hypothetical protein
MGEWDDLVEATIEAIHVDASRKEICIDVKCAGDQNVRRKIVAMGVDDFVANEMRLSNVIDRVTLLGAQDVTTPEIPNRLFYLMRGTEPTPSDLEWPVLKQKLALISDGKLSLLELEPVYGASVILLAESFRLDRVIGLSAVALPSSAATS